METGCSDGDRDDELVRLNLLIGAAGVRAGEEETERDCGQRGFRGAWRGIRYAAGGGPEGQRRQAKPGDGGVAQAGATSMHD